LRSTFAILLAAFAAGSCDATAASSGGQGSAALPALTGRIVDSADILSSSAEAGLAQASAEFERRRTDQLVVVTLPSLNGKSIEQTGMALGRSWGVGQRGKDNGVLLIVAPTERKVRIEVGYGLERALTDEEAKAIIETRILPFFRQGGLEQGTVAGAEAIVAELDRSLMVEPRS